jgi:hypothetical protein
MAIFSSTRALQTQSPTLPAYPLHTATTARITVIANFRSFAGRAVGHFDKLSANGFGFVSKYENMEIQ